MHFCQRRGFPKNLPLFFAVTSIGCGIGQKKKDPEPNEEPAAVRGVTCNPDTSGTLRFTGSRVERCGNAGWDDIRNFSSPTEEKLACIALFQGAPVPCDKIFELLPRTASASCSAQEIEKGIVISCENSNVTIRNGEDGEKGTTGPKGPKGTRGEKGERGDKGGAGSKGPTNPEIGPQGPMGEKGETGEKGERGDAGTEKGERGPIGDSGPVGEKGDAGPQGPMGPTGTQMGSQGPQGLQGLQGERGPHGGVKFPPISGGGRGGWCRLPDYTYTSEITFGEQQ